MVDGGGNSARGGLKGAVRRWRQVNVLAAGAILLGAASAAGQYMGEDHLVPVVARTQGAGQPPTCWVTDVVIHNVNPYPKTIGLEFLPFDQVNEFDCQLGMPADVGSAWPKISCGASRITRMPVPSGAST